MILCFICLHMYIIYFYHFHHITLSWFLPLLLIPFLLSSLLFFHVFSFSSSFFSFSPTSLFVTKWISWGTWVRIHLRERRHLTMATPLEESVFPFSVSHCVLFSVINPWKAWPSGLPLHTSSCWGAQSYVLLWVPEYSSHVILRKHYLSPTFLLPLHSF